MLENKFQILENEFQILEILFLILELQKRRFQKFLAIICPRMYHTTKYGEFPSGIHVKTWLLKK